VSGIELKDVSFRYPKQQVLDQVNLKVERGSIICVFGGSGQGKSTLLRILAGLESPESGSFAYNGEPHSLIEHNPLNISRKGVSMVFQNSALISNLTVFDNVALPLRYHETAPEKEIKERVHKALKSMLIQEHAHYYPHQISVGIQKRVAVARAIITDPTTLLMDEPTAGLDLLNRRGLLALINNTNQLRYVTVILVTHDLRIAHELRANIVILYKGKISEPIPATELFTSDHPFLQEVLYEMRNI
jgi:phospholipid/cholesterol/gamma-HCH transport system ATP-binding protein